MSQDRDNQDQTDSKHPERTGPSEAGAVHETPGRFAQALDYASRYFMGKADVQVAARRLAARLEELGIPYAIAGGLAVSAHGHVRVTVDVDVLLAPDDLELFKGITDVQNQVPIDILLAGDYPGDGRPKPVRLPDPRQAGVSIDGISVVSLPCLVELKLASGMSAPDRLQDLADVIALIRANSLTREFAAGLDGSVRRKYEELWEHAQRPQGEE